MVAFPGQHLTNDAGLPDRVYGKHGTMMWAASVAESQRPVRGGVQSPERSRDEVRLPIKQRRDLEGNFIDVLRGQDQLACNAHLGCSTMVAIKMAVESTASARPCFGTPNAKKW